MFLYFIVLRKNSNTPFFQCGPNLPPGIMIWIYNEDSFTQAFLAKWFLIRRFLNFFLYKSYVKMWFPPHCGPTLSPGQLWFLKTLFYTIWPMACFHTSLSLSGEIVFEEKNFENANILSIVPTYLPMRDAIVLHFYEIKSPS